MKKANLVLSGICSILALYVIMESQKFPAGAGGVPGSGIFPTIIATLLLISCISIIVTSLKMENSEEIQWLATEVKPVYISMVAVVAYVAILAQVGFVVTSIVFMTIMIQWFKKGNPAINALIAVIFVGIVYGVFNGLLNVPMNFGFLI